MFLTLIILVWTTAKDGGSGRQAGTCAACRNPASMDVATCRPWHWIPAHVPCGYPGGYDAFFASIANQVP